MFSGVHLQVGKESLRVDPGAKAVIQHLPANRVATLDAIAEATLHALEHPVDFPPLSAALVPGDHLVIAADAEIPQLQPIVEGILQAVGQLDLTISLLLSENAHAESIAGLTEAFRGRAEVIAHTPDDQKQLGYLAATEGAEPIYLNRVLLDADVVLPVVLARPTGGIDPDFASAQLFPMFADRASQRRVRNQWLHPESSKENEPMQAAWWLGIQLVLGILPADGETLLSIVAGTAQGIAEPLVHRADDRWNYTSTAPSELVIACVDGDDQQQTWDNVARAIYAARRLVRPGGTIAICSELAESPGPSLMRLRGTDQPERTLKRLANDPYRDALPAALLLQSRSEGRVLLQSHLQRESVEELGLGVIEGAEQLSRLIQQHATCTVLHSAQFSVS